jgi:hypothetical protein
MSVTFRQRNQLQVSLLADFFCILRLHVALSHANPITWINWGCFHVPLLAGLVATPTIETPPRETLQSVQLVWMLL